MKKLAGKDNKREDVYDEVSQELDNIRALGNVIGAVCFDEAGVDREHIGTLGFMIFDLAGQVADKLRDLDQPAGAKGGE